MIQAFIIKGSFQDSVSLMLVSRQLSKANDVRRVSVMMGTPANKGVFKETGLWSEVFEQAGPNDICVAMETESDDQQLVETMRQRLFEAIDQLSQGRKKSGYAVVHTLERAMKKLPEASVALVSVAGLYAGDVANALLESGKHVMLFSDNVPLETEKKLKQFAQRRNLLVMGPDCGTSILHGVPLAFANRIPSGPVGIVGASGTGIQEVTSQLAKRSIGITHALGLGGRDLKEEVGGISAKEALRLLDNDADSKVVVFISKPPAASVREQLDRLMHSMSKPVVALFLGTHPVKRQDGNVYYAYTLEEAAQLATELVNTLTLIENLPPASGQVIGLFTGGTLANETAMLLSELYGLEESPEHVDGMMLQHRRAQVIDLGDDVYTRGRPHPMIDPSVRGEHIERLPESCDLLLVDIVLGYGAVSDPAGALVESLNIVRAGRRNPLTVIATLTGTDEDPQNLEAQRKKMQEAGIIVVESTRQAVMAVQLLQSQTSHCKGESSTLLSQAPAIINVGLRSFADDLFANGVSCIQVDWAPPCGGNEYLQRLLSLMK